MASTLNHILTVLPENEQAAIGPYLTPQTLATQEVLYEPGEIIGSLLFPETAMISIVRPFRSGDALETGAIGCEGIADPVAALGSRRTGARIVAQIGGTGWRIDRDDYLRLSDQLPDFRRHTLAFCANFLEVSLLQVACNRLHNVEQRLARWLLTTADRSPTDDLPLTHEILSLMLGVYRPTVTHAMRSLREAGLVASGRGRVRILDPEGLRATACECYEIARERLFGRVRQTTGPEH